MSDKAAPPAVPPSHLLPPMPPSRLAAQPKPRAFVAALAVPTQTVKNARQQAANATEQIRRSLTSLNGAVTQVEGALKVHDGSDEAAAEFVKAGADPKTLKDFVANATALLDKLMPPASAA